MTHILFREISPDQVRSISSPMVKELAELCQSLPDSFQVECLQTISISEGGLEPILPSPILPSIEVAGFDCRQAIRDKFAAIVHQYVCSSGLPELEIVFREDNNAKEDDKRHKLEESNRQLKEQLRKAHQATRPSGILEGMSTKLRDALRE